MVMVAVDVAAMVAAMVAADVVVDAASEARETKGLCRRWRTGRASPRFSA